MFGKDWMDISFDSTGYLDHLFEDPVALQPVLVTFRSAGLVGRLENLQLLVEVLFLPQLFAFGVPGEDVHIGTLLKWMGENVL